MHIHNFSANRLISNVIGYGQCDRVQSTITMVTGTTGTDTEATAQTQIQSERNQNDFNFHKSNKQIDFSLFFGSENLQ